MHVKLTVINIEYCNYCLASVAPGTIFPNASRFDLLLQASLLQLNKRNSNAGHFPFKSHYQYTCIKLR